MKTLRNLATLAALSLVLLACGGASGPAGKWDIDLKETMAAAEKAMNEQLAAVPAEQRAMVEQMMKPMLDAMKEMKGVLEIKADGSFTVDSTTPDGKSSKVAGTWTLAGDKITMVGKEEGKEETDTIVGTLAADTITCEIGEGQQKGTMVFRRQK
jgi:uncharacterized protein (TIGR03066 family)